MDIDSPAGKRILAPCSQWLSNHEIMIQSTSKAAPRFARELLVPNPKLRLREQVHEVMRVKHYSVRTEAAHWIWMGQFILFHGKRHPREMGTEQVHEFLAQLATARNV